MTQPSTSCCKDITGPENATSAILLVYDIFGFWTQTLLGADILASTKTSSSPQGIKVFVPDFFGSGNEADIAYWPADTDEKWEYIFKVFREQAEKEKSLRKTLGIINVLKERDEVKNLKSWGLLDIVGVQSDNGFARRTIFKPGAQTHPSLVDSEDAKLVTIPQL
ncbi:hypothetical protein BPAE_0129g00170 [Botrytis paeoniae]|uniref:Dienelactone hydrolase domain-containing protein n=1 Tax=Botrytis paeoniae TaxID=278948 RepID=A0A4Z1FLP5_9HELO|nr:hypothetical protein BPAE_0129g00170 [Botrytis paeoniae]